MFDVRAHPGLLLKLDDAVNSLQPQTLLKGELEVSVVDPVALLITQIGDQLLTARILITSDGQSLGSVGAKPALGHLHPLRAEGEVVVALVELGRILEIHFEEGPALAIICKVQNSPRIPGRTIAPSKATRGESL